MLDIIVKYFFNQYHLANRTKWFKLTLYGIVITSCINWLWHYAYYFGDNNIIFRNPHAFQSFKDIAFCLYMHPTYGYLAIIACTCIASVSLILKRAWLITDLILWLLILNIHYAIYPGLTGGDYLLNQFLLMNCFLSFRFQLSTTVMGDIKVLLHNLSVIALITQVCLLYFLSGFAKLMDDSWLDGAAIGKIVRINHFSLNDAEVEQNFTSILLNYIVLFYQLFFPVLVWLQKIKKPLLIIGIIMHLYIALFMGLFSFGIIMIAGYIYFWPESKKNTEKLVSLPHVYN